MRRDRWAGSVMRRESAEDAHETVVDGLPAVRNPLRRRRYRTLWQHRAGCRAPSREGRLGHGASAGSAESPDHRRSIPPGIVLQRMPYPCPECMRRRWSRRTRMGGAIATSRVPSRRGRAMLRIDRPRCFLRAGILQRKTCPRVDSHVQRKFSASEQSRRFEDNVAGIVDEDVERT